MKSFCRTGLLSLSGRESCRITWSGFPLRLALGLTVLFTSLLAGCSASKPETSHASLRADITVKDVLSRLPARDGAEARWVSALLLESAPESITELCIRLDTVKPGDDAQVRYALSGLTAYTTLPGQGEDRLVYAGALCSALGVMHNPQSQAFVLEQLRLAGGQESVGTLSTFLVDEKLCEPAVQALLSIRTPDVSGNILEGVRRVDGSRRITLVKALGELHSHAAVPDLTKWSQENDPELRDASLAALAAIGDPQSAQVIRGASLQLVYARRLAEDGNPALSEKICRGLFATTNPSSTRAAALDQLADLPGARVTDDLIAAIREPDAQLRAAALEIAAGTKGEGITERWVSVMQQSDPDLRADIIRMLGRRKDPAALPAVNHSLADQDSSVRIAAVEAAARLGGIHAIDGILGVLEHTERPEEIAAVRNALVSLPPGSTVPAVIQELGSATPGAQVMLLQFCGAFGRHAPSSAIFPFTRSQSAPVRLAAMKALESSAQPDDMAQLVQMLLSARSEAEVSAMQRTLAATAARNPAPASRADAILAVLDTARAEHKVTLLRTLGRVGGAKSLAALSRGITSKDPAVKDASLRALADWPDAEGFDTLLAVARSKQPMNYRVLALRGCMRIVEDGEFSDNRSARMLGSVMAAATRPEEKRMALASLGKLRSLEALRITSNYLGDEAVGLDAVLAIRGITEYEEEKDYHPLTHAEVTRFFVEKNASERVRKQIREYEEADSNAHAAPPEGFVALFNGKDLKGWKGLVADPPTRARMTTGELAKAQATADSLMRAQWSVEDGVLMFNADGFANICTAKDYANFELLVDWRIEKKGDSGIYLRGSPQVQIWDPAVGTEGSGGLYNNQKNPRTPTQKADKPVGQWNTFRIRMIGQRVTVYLNDVLVVDNVVLENYWEREKPIYPTGQIELQAHNSPLYFRNIFIKELPAEKEKQSGLLFNGKDLTGWELVGGSTPWGVKDGVLYTEGGGGGWISTVKEYDNFKLDLEFRVPEGGNSGVFLRTPREGDPAYVGMEIQVLDDYAAEYKDLHPWQYTGSIYGVVPPSVRVSKKAGEWQHYVIVADGPHVTVTLNDKLIVDADLISHLDQEQTHPGLKRRKGYIGLQNHSTRIEYRNIRITELD